MIGFKYKRMWTASFPDDSVMKVRTQKLLSFVENFLKKNCQKPQTGTSYIYKSLIRKVIIILLYYNDMYLRYYFLSSRKAFFSAVKDSARLSSSLLVLVTFETFCDEIVTLPFIRSWNYPWTWVTWNTLGTLTSIPWTSIWLKSRSSWFHYINRTLYDWFILIW